MEMLSALTGNPLFAEFSAEELDELVRGSELRSYVPGQKIIAEGEPGRFVGVVLEGTAQAQSHEAGGRPLALGEIPTGAYFGEISLVSGAATMADVVALTACQVLQIPHRLMSEALRTRPQAMSHMARTITGRLIQRSQAEAAPSALPASETLPPPETTGVARVLAVHCTTGHLHYRYYDTGNEMNNTEGEVEGVGTAQAVHTSHGVRWERREPVGNTLEEAVAAVAAGLVDRAMAGSPEGLGLAAVGHQVAHGGEKYSGAARVDEIVRADLAALAERLCPENWDNLAGIAAFSAALPGVPQVAVFDTAFFAALPACAFLYAGPYEWYAEQGWRRYGRAGLIHHQAALLAAAHLQRPLRELSMISCDLGPVPSLCAIRQGRAVECSGGLTDLGGLPGASNSGDLDPGLVLTLLEREGLAGGEAANLLRKQSGLAGLSGTSGELAALLRAAEAGDDRANLAVETFCYALRKQLGAYCAVLGELDAVLFTGPAGVGLPGLRARLCEGLESLGVELDAALNQSPRTDARGVSDVSPARAAVRLLVIPTEEGRMVAGQAAEAVGLGQLGPAILANRRPIPIGISVRHLHLSAEHVAALYGPGHKLTYRAPLSQPGQFACEETVNLIGPKHRLERVRVLGPERPTTQVEIARTECFALGVQAPVRMSGDLAQTPGLRLEGPAGAVELSEGVICASRHLHVSPEEALLLGVRDRDEISVRVEGEQSLIFNKVAVRVHPEYRLDMHIDTDEANAARLDQGAVGYIESVDLRG